jgi:Uma2 family endonuclease
MINSASNANNKAPIDGASPMALTSTTIPPQGAWTEDAYLSLNTNRLVEFSNGYLELLPMPTFLHQLVVKYLFDLLDAFVSAHAPGETLFAPLPVRLWPGKMREPDIMYFQPKRLHNLKQPPNGADLVMEVVIGSPDDRERDLKTKRAEYAKARIAEYWIVDPDERKITVLTLGKKTYRVHGVFDPGSTATSVLLPGFAVNVTATFAAGEGQDKS